MNTNDENQAPETFIFAQVIPLGLTVVIGAVLIAAIYFEIILLNRLPSQDISLKLRLSDILIGGTIYLKTSVDFAIFIGNLMHIYKGWKNRVMIELGTAVGNALGTIIILAIWSFFREVKLLLAAMIVLAALVLFKLAEEGLEHTHEGSYKLPNWFYAACDWVETVLHKINGVLGVVLDKIMPNLSMRPSPNLTFMGLFAMSFSVPFILGLDDFAGYVPVFDIVNVFGFATGVILGHMVLNILLFISPSKTITVVKNPIISAIGSIAFIALAVWGLIEAYRILFAH